MPVPTVHIVSTGYEVLRGFTPDTNATWLARRATEAGAQVVGRTTVGDAHGDLVRALETALASASCVLVTGGLGPTEDDRTREALAEVAGVPLAFDASAWSMVVERFARVDREPSGMQRRQAMIPSGFSPMPNAQGTAPGVEGLVRGRRIFLLPGPPREMRAMFDACVRPAWLVEGGFEPCAARVLWTAGVPEAEVAEAIEPHMRRDEPTVGTHPDDGEVAVRILARGERADARADALRDELAALLAPHVVSTDEDRRVQHALVERLAASRRVLVTAESVTGGLVSRMLTEVPGASAVFHGGFVTYSDAWKRDRLGVPADLLERHGAVSEPVALAMGEGALARTNADVAVATTGVAGPGPDERGIPAGTAYVAVASRFASPSCVVVRAAIPRVAFQRRVAVTALDQVRRLLWRS